MEVITNGHKNTMGETGAGITSEDQINMDKPDNFMNKLRVPNLLGIRFLCTAFCGLTRYLSVMGNQKAYCGTSVL